jgi:hypothetical protein
MILASTLDYAILFLKLSLHHGENIISISLRVRKMHLDPGDRYKVQANRSKNRSNVCIPASEYTEIWLTTEKKLWFNENNCSVPF